MGRAELLIARQDASCTFQSLHYIPAAHAAAAEQCGGGGTAVCVMARVRQRDTASLQDSTWGLAHVLLLPHLFSVGPVVQAPEVRPHCTKLLSSLF